MSENTTNVEKLRNLPSDTTVVPRSTTTMTTLLSEDTVSSINVGGYYAIGDGGGGIFNWDSTANKNTANGGTIIDPSVSLALQGTGVGSGCWVREFNGNIHAEWFGAKGDGSTDDTVAIQAAVDTGIPVEFQGKTYAITDTITVSSSPSYSFHGKGERKTAIKFVNAVADKVMFDLASSSSNSVFYDMHIYDATPGTSTFMRMQDAIPDTDGQSNYKNGTNKCRVTDFKTGVILTSADPLDGTTHAFCSECMFLHSRFKNNRTTFLIQNIQAVDLTLIGTDIENDDAGETYTFFKDEVGCDVKIYGGSFVGKGKLYDGSYPIGGTSLWQAAKFSMTDSRMELRATHTGTVMTIPNSASFTQLDIDIDTCQFLCFSQNLSLVDIAGRCNVNIKNSTALNGSLAINLYPTTSITGSFSSPYYQSYGSVNVDGGCIGFKYVKNTSSPYGTYDERYTIPVTVANQGVSSNGSFTVDANSFLTQTSQTYMQRAVGIGHAESRKLIYNIDRPLSSFADIKFTIPFGATPMKLIMFKHPNIRSVEVNYELYAVKDVADWAGGTFDYTLDAILLADSTTTINKAGYMEYPISLTSNYFDAGTYFQSGLGAWLEGRMYLRITDAASFNGFVGIEYM